MMIIYYFKTSICTREWIIIINCFSCESIAISNSILYHCEWNLLCIREKERWVCVCVRERGRENECVCACVYLSSVNFERVNANKINIYSIMCVNFVCSLAAHSFTALVDCEIPSAFIYYEKNVRKKLHKNTLAWLIYIRYTLIRMALSAHIQT